MNLAAKNEKELKEKYEGVDIDKIIKRWINHYNKNPFDESVKEVWIDSIKDKIILENLDIEEPDQLNEEETKKLLQLIYKELIVTLKKFCDLKEEMYPIIAMWIIGTYIHDEFETFPYLFFNAMRGSGKTRILRLIAALSKNGELLGSMSESVLFRTAKESTMCIDEFEQVNSQEKQSLREFLNSAYKKGQKIKRMKKTKEDYVVEDYVVEEFEVYTSICMANIWGMEEVLGDRCITIVLEKSNRPIITKLVEDFGDDPQITTLKNNLSLIECSLCNVVMPQNIVRNWNNYILQKYTNPPNHTITTNTTSNTYTTKTTHTTTNTQFYDKIDGIGIEGRHFELTFPLFVIARFLGSFDEFLVIVKKMIDEKKVEDYVESKDVQLFDFVSGQDHMNFISITKLTNKFREFIGVDDKEETFVNSRWMGRALKRLVLIREKTRIKCQKKDGNV